MSASSDERMLAASIAEEALAEVFDAEAVSGLREDSPLSVLGMAPDDVVCVAEAIARSARRRGLVRELGDADFISVETVADLIDAIGSGGAG